jgi:hypothetical protein
MRMPSVKFATDNPEGGKYQKRGVLYVAHGLWAMQKARADLRMRMLLVPLAQPHFQ